MFLCLFVVFLALYLNLPREIQCITRVLRMLSVPYAEKRDFWVCIKVLVLHCWYALLFDFFPCSLVQNVVDYQTSSWYIFCDAGCWAKSCSQFLCV